MIAVSVCLSDIPKERMTKAKNGKFYVDLILAEKREPDQYGKTHTLYVSQTKEEREAKIDKVYVGNGKSLVRTANSMQQIKNEVNPDFNEPSDLPF